MICTTSNPVEDLVSSKTNQNTYAQTFQMYSHFRIDVLEQANLSNLGKLTLLQEYVRLLCHIP